MDRFIRIFTAFNKGSVIIMLPMHFSRLFRVQLLTYLHYFYNIQYYYHYREMFPYYCDMFPYGL